jgi:hypothetical protein
MPSETLRARTRLCHQCDEASHLPRRKHLLSLSFRAFGYYNASATPLEAYISLNDTLRRGEIGNLKNFGLFRKPASFSGTLAINAS